MFEIYPVRCPLNVDLSDFRQPHLPDIRMIMEAVGKDEWKLPEDKRGLRTDYGLDRCANFLKEVERGCQVQEEYEKGNLKGSETDLEAFQWFEAVRVASVWAEGMLYLIERSTPELVGATRRALYGLMTPASRDGLNLAEEDKHFTDEDVAIAREVIQALITFARV